MKKYLSLATLALAFFYFTPAVNANTVVIIGHRHHKHHKHVRHHRHHHHSAAHINNGNV